MSAFTISSKQLILLQGLINQAIKSDATAEQRLASLNNKSLRISCDQPDIDICIIIEHGQVALEQGHFHEKPNSHIEGDIRAFFDLFTSNDKASALINSNLRLKGDSQLLIDLQQAMTALNFDWEYQLAKLLGDIPAHQLGKAGRKIIDVFKKSRPIFKRHVQEFIFEEAELFPRQQEMDAWINGIQQAQQQLERMEARLANAAKLIDAWKLRNKHA